MSPTPYTQAGHRAIGGYGSKEEAGVVVANFKLVQLLINCLAGGNGRPGIQPHFSALTHKSSKEPAGSC